MTIQLSDDYLKEYLYQSSKGNQLKWFRDGIWYKADYTGYEGLSECVVSELLKQSPLQTEEFICYRPETILYHGREFQGCSSKDFLESGWRIITLERLFQNAHGVSLYRSLYQMHDVKERLKFLVDQVAGLTGLRDFGTYMAKLLTIDALFLNEDRHMHNIAVLESESREYAYCPIFDNGAALLSDTTLDYPMGEDVYTLIGHSKPKTISMYSYSDQLDAAEEVYGDTIRFSFTGNDVENVLKRIENYSDDVKRRVETIVREQMRRYPYLFR